MAPVLVSPRPLESDRRPVPVARRDVVPVRLGPGEAGRAKQPKARSRLGSLAAWSVYIVLVIAAVLLGPRIAGMALGTDYPLATVSSQSMWPVLKEGDMVLLAGVSSSEDLREGDIIAFRHGGGLAIHRIASVDGERITTRGDANFQEDAPIEFDDVVGRAVKMQGRLAKIPYVGHVAKVLGSILGTTTESSQPVPSADESSVSGAP
jgi:signal peptidase I